MIYSPLIKDHRVNLLLLGSFETHLKTSVLLEEGSHEIVCILLSVGWLLESETALMSSFLHKDKTEDAAAESVRALISSFLLKEETEDAAAELVAATSRV